MLTGLPFLDQIDGKSLSGLDDKNASDFEFVLNSVQISFV